MSWTVDLRRFARLEAYVLAVAALVPMYVVGRGHPILVAAMAAGLSGGLAVPLLVPLLVDADRVLHRRLANVLLAATTTALALFAVAWGLAPLVGGGVAGGFDPHPLVSAGTLSIFVIALAGTRQAWSCVERRTAEIGVAAGLTLSFWLVSPLLTAAVLGPAQLAVFLAVIGQRTDRETAGKAVAASGLVLAFAFLAGSLAQGHVLPPRMTLAGWGGVAAQPALVLLTLGPIPAYALLRARPDSGGAWREPDA